MAKTIINVLDKNIC